MNEKNKVLEKIYQLNALYLETLSEQVLFDMESIMLDYLHYYPEDSDMWLRLVMIEFTPPLEDYDKIENYINTMLIYDQGNIKGLLVLAYAQYTFRGAIQEDLFMQLKSSCRIADKELLSMIYLAQAWYYESLDKEEYEKALLKSIDYCNYFVHNFVLLGELYFKKGKALESNEMIQVALKNIQKIYKTNDFVDITDIDSFFDEFFKGIGITEENLRIIQKHL